MTNTWIPSIKGDKLISTFSKTIKLYKINDKIAKIWSDPRTINYCSLSRARQAFETKAVSAEVGVNRIETAPEGMDLMTAWRRRPMILHRDPSLLSNLYSLFSILYCLFERLFNFYRSLLEWSGVFLKPQYSGNDTLPEFIFETSQQRRFFPRFVPGRVKVR